MSAEKPVPTDEIEAATSKVKTFVFDYLRTIRISLRAPESLPALSRQVRSDHSAQPLPPFRFFFVSLAIAAAIERLFWPTTPAAAFELHGAVANLRGLVETLPLGVPILSTLSLLAFAVIPWFLLKLSRSPTSFKTIAYIFCYQQGAILLPWSAVTLLLLGLVDILDKSLPDRLALLFGVSAFAVATYALYWTAVRITRTSGRVLAPVLALLFSSSSLAVLQVAAGPTSTYRHPSGGMIPTLEPHDRIVVNRWIYRLRPPMPGELVSFYPMVAGIRQNRPFVFRVVAVPGDSVRYDNSTLFLNGQAASSRFVGTQVREDTKYSVLQEKLGAAEYEVLLLKQPHSDDRNLLRKGLVVAKDSYVVLGDNRDSANDSRYLGQITADQIEGKVYFRVLPLTRSGKL